MSCSCTSSDVCSMRCVSMPSLRASLSRMRAYRSHLSCCSAVRNKFARFSATSLAFNTALLTGMRPVAVTSGPVCALSFPIPKRLRIAWNHRRTVSGWTFSLREHSGALRPPVACSCHAWITASPRRWRLAYASTASGTPTSASTVLWCCSCADCPMSHTVHGAARDVKGSAYASRCPQLHLRKCSPTKHLPTNLGVHCFSGLRRTPHTLSFPLPLRGTRASTASTLTTRRPDRDERGDWLTAEPTGAYRPQARPPAGDLPRYGEGETSMRSTGRGPQGDGGMVRHPGRGAAFALPSEVVSDASDPRGSTVGSRNPGRTET